MAEEVHFESVRVNDNGEENDDETVTASDSRRSDSPCEVLNPHESMQKFCDILEKTLPPSLEQFHSLVDEYEDTVHQIACLTRQVDSEREEVESRNEHIVQSIANLNKVLNRRLEPRGTSMNISTSKLANEVNDFEINVKKAFS